MSSCILFVLFVYLINYLFTICCGMMLFLFCLVIGNDNEINFRILLSIIFNISEMFDYKHFKVYKIESETNCCDSPPNRLKTPLNLSTRFYQKLLYYLKSYLPKHYSTHSLWLIFSVASFFFLSMTYSLHYILHLSLLISKIQ